MAGTLTLVTSNRLEILCDRLAGLLDRPPEDPLETEIVLVQSRGMERWLRMELARAGRLGICANVSFPFPNRFMADVVEAIFPGRLDGEPFEREQLAWRILRLLPTLAGDARLAPATAYLEKGAADDDARSYDFAWTIADRLDQYVLYRPELVLEWEAGEGRDWQAELWRAIRRDVESAEAPEGSRRPVHRAALRRALLTEMHGSDDLASRLPFSRIAVFGVSVLPPFHLSVLQALSRHIGVHLFLMNPSRQYWSLVMSEGAKARLLRRQAEAHPGVQSPSAADEALESGNPLLASLGKLGRAFFDQVIECEPDDQPDFAEPGTDSMLHLIQSDILDMVDRGAAAGPKPHPVSAADASLLLCSCHSAMREAEVLHDYLLELFRRRPDLTPGDVLVMCPELETYAPLLQAALGSGAAEAIPLSVSDRPILGQSSLAETVLRVLSLPESRFAASEVLSLVADSRIRMSFGLEPAEADLLADWIRGAGVRWGLDEEHRHELGLPAERQNSWEAGLDRLLLGCVLAGGGPSGEGGGGGQPYKGILPTDGPEGAESTALGRLVDLLTALRRARVLLRGRYETREWPDVVRRTLSSLLGEDLGGDEEAEELDSVLRAVARETGGAGASPPLGVGAMRAALRRRLGEAAPAGRFLTGRLTICTLQPMRSIPASVICLVGMNDGAFPARARPQGFDLMARSPHKGDRSRVEEDRYLFLETILSARDALYVSYVGQSIRDNSAIAPAVPVSLLLDYAEQAFRCPGYSTVRERLVQRHPLQPWSPRYLRSSAADPRGLFTYSRRDALASRALVAPEHPPRLFCPAGLAPPERPERRIPVDEIAGFLANPSRYFVRRRLGVTLPAAEEAAPDREPFVLADLDRYGVARQLLEILLRAGAGKEQLEAAAVALRAEGRLPHGLVGELELDGVAARVQDLRERVERYRTGGPEPARGISVELPQTTLELALPATYRGCVLDFRWGSLRAKDRILSWLQHLVLCASGTMPEPWVSVFVATDKTVETDPIPDARERLAEIVLFYREAWCRPLPFFPETSLAYAEAALSGDGARALARARTKWEPYPGQKGRSESEDPYVELCFGDADPLGDEFRGMAASLLDPCIRAQRLQGGGS